MAKIEIYTSPFCGYCVRAKQLLGKKNAPYTEINIAGGDDVREAMVARANGRRTVPQIFIDGRHIGGCDDLYELESAGTLDALLAASNA